MIICFPLHSHSTLKSKNKILIYLDSRHEEVMAIQLFNAYLTSCKISVPCIYMVENL